MDDPKKLIQEANGFLRNAQNNMFSGKNEQALDLLNKADELVIKAQYIIPEDFQVKSLFQKAEKMRKDLERKGVVTRPGGSNDLPFEVQAQINRIRECILKKQADWAKRELDSYYARFAGPFTDLPQIKELQQELGKLEAEIDALNIEKVRKARETLRKERESQEMCQIWEQKFKAIPYFDGTPLNAHLLLDQKNYYQQACSLIQDFEKEAFSGQLSVSLEGLMRDIRLRIAEFPFLFLQTAESMAAEITSSIENRIDFINRDIAWKNDKVQTPYIIGKNEIDAFQQRIDELRPLFVEKPQGLDSVSNALCQLVEMDQQRRFERSKRIAIRPEAMTGTQAEEPLSFAQDKLLNEHPDAKVVKAAVVRLWENKHIEEWADSTRTEWVRKNIAETTVQIIADLPDETRKLFTLHLEKIINSDGSFGKLSGHIMYEDLMIREAVA